MTKEELLKKLTNPLFLADVVDEILDGLIPFDMLTEVIRDKQNNVATGIRIAHLIHPDCTLEVFKRLYFPVVNSIHEDWVYYQILGSSSIFRHLEAIVHILDVNCRDTFYECIKYTITPFEYNKLLKNPHIPDEFRIICFELTGDSSVLPKDTQDCFVF